MVFSDCPKCNGNKRWRSSCGAVMTCPLCNGDGRNPDEVYRPRPGREINYFDHVKLQGGHAVVEFYATGDALNEIRDLGPITSMSDRKNYYMLHTKTEAELSVAVSFIKSYNNF